MRSNRWGREQVGRAACDKMLCFISILGMDPKEAWQIRKRGFKIMADLGAQKLCTLTHEGWIRALNIVWFAREPNQRILSTRPDSAKS